MNPARRSMALVLLFLVLILALAAGLRFYRIGEQSLWSDEGNSAALAVRSLQQITADAGNDIHPPLYYWLLHLWVGIFGTSEAGLRSLSALVGVMLVLATFSLGRAMYDDATGLAAAFVSALAPFQVYFGQEARMYVLLTLECTLAALLFWRLVKQDTRRAMSPLPGLPQGSSQASPPSDGQPKSRLRLLPPTGQLLIFTFAAGLYTHYAFPLMMALLTGLYLLWILLTRRWGSAGLRVLRWMVWVVLAVVLYIPWLATTARQLTAWSVSDTVANLGELLRKALTMLSLGPIARDMAGAWPVLALALVGAIPWQIRQRASSWGGSALFWLRWLTPLTWTCAPLAMILVLDLHREAFLKFLLIASPAFCLLLARGILGPAEALARVRLRQGAAAPWLSWRSLLSGGYVLVSLALVSGLFGAVLARYYDDPAVARDDYRGIAEFIAATGQPNDAILLDAPGQSEVFQYYYRGNLPVFPLPRQRPVDPEAARQELEKLRDHDKVYAVYWATQEADPDGAVEQWLDTNAYKTLDQWRGNVRLAAYVMPSHRPPEESADNLDLRFGNDISLLGYRGWNASPAAGEIAQLQIAWRADRQPAQRYKVFLQLLDSRDQVIAQSDVEPAGGSRPTDGWTPGETVLDNHGLLIPPGTPPGAYRRIVGLYDPATMERLRLPDGSDHVDLPSVTVLRGKTPALGTALDAQVDQRFDFGAISLLGHDRYKRGFGHAPDTPIRPGDPLHLTFYWQANAQPRADWWFELVLSDRNGQSVARLQAPLVSDSYSSRLWQAGEIVRGEHDLVIPESLPPGTYRLSLVMNPDTGTPAGTAYLGNVEVTK